MSSTLKNAPTVDALLALLPGAQARQVSQKLWQSATFSGQQYLILLALPIHNAMRRAEAFRDTLPDHEFDLNRYIVGDILVEDIIREEDHVLLKVAALLLEM